MGAQTFLQVSFFFLKNLALDPFEDTRLGYTGFSDRSIIVY